MARRLLICGLVLALLFLGCARASAAPPPEGWGALELRVAQEYWGATPNLGCSSYSVEWDAELAPDRAGEATMPTGQEGRVPCEMRIGPAETPRDLCYIVIHEYGHWLGLDHDRGGVMSANPFILYSTDIPACMKQPNR